MYLGDKPNILVRLRRWWKSYLDQSRWDGFFKPLIEDFLPGYRRLNKWYWAIRHRTINVFHKIDTGLEPGYYDIDSLMVHGMFSLLVRYIEDEKGGVDKCLKEIENLNNNWGEGYDDIPEEHRQGHIDAAKSQAHNLQEALRIYRWWKEEYPKFEDYDNNPWSQHCDKKREAGGMSALDRMMNHTPCAFDSDGDPTMYTLHNDDETPEEAAASRVALDTSHAYENRWEEETTEALIDLIKLRKTL